MIEIKNRRDRDVSFIALRGMMNRHTREDRYWKPYLGNARMPTVIREYIKFFTDAGKISDGSRLYIQKARESYNVLQRNYISALGMYANEYIIPFINIGDIRCAALKISYTTEEQLLIDHFIGQNKNDSKVMLGLQLICYQLIVEKQKIRALSDMDTIGVLYSTFPEEDQIIDYGYIQYRYSCPEVNGFVLAAIEGARNRGVSIDEIERVIPDNPEARFLTGTGWDFNLIAQIDALMPGIAEQV